MDWYDEHEHDRLDTADGYVILDGILVRLEHCKSCLALPCVCDDGEPPAQHRNHRRAHHER